jgi:hypothetical protein
MTFAEKYVRSPGTVAVAGRQVKRYHVSIEPEIEANFDKAAAEFLARLLPAPDGETPPAWLVILHRGATEVAA